MSCFPLAPPLLPLLPRTHPVVGMGPVVGELAHRRELGATGGVEPLRGAGGHVVEDEPEAGFLRRTGFVDEQF